MNLKSFFLAFLFFVCFLLPAFPYQVLLTDEDFVYELYEPQDLIPPTLLEEGRAMYFEAYQHPKLHLGHSVKSLNIDETRFRSYEEFIDQMFREDFESYNHLDTIKRYYFQARTLSDGRVVGICVVYPEDQSGHYFLDHIGVHCEFRRRGIGRNLIEEMKKSLADFKEIALDTRTFNTTARALYEAMGFQIEPINPRSHKQHTYFHYVLKSPSTSFVDFFSK
jgi:ribosomal protein S18 acetylase RimI-like enzyme